MLFKTPGGSEVIYSTDGITGSARNMCETEILSQLLEEVIASVQRFFFFPFLLIRVEKHFRRGNIL